MSGRQDIEDSVAAVPANSGSPEAQNTGGATVDHGTGQKRKEAPTTAGASTKKQQKAIENRAIYASNIPRDATFEEIEETFKKAGIIEKGVDGKPRIKMYTDEDGKFNGDVLIVYFKKESIELAIMRYDGWPFRLDAQKSEGVIKVEEADMSFKKNTDGEVVKSKLVRKDRKAAERTRAELNRKLAEWSEDEEEEVQKAFAPKKNKWSKYVIIKKAFTLAQINDKEDEGAVLEIKEDMREAAEKFGEVTKVVLYDKEAEGILTVRFKEFEGAEAFVLAFDGKGYNHQKLQLSIADDRPRFQKSGKEDTSDVEDNVRRMEAYMDGDKTDEDDE
ncbi:hypothetical protein DPSP01_000317 [Paraphaeosphaeria sporulosa]|uniref:RRM domain-containing protein n=1 Tax=Paraphaeosphaeria sporulosa TaxID=1460663 RepID=A0A177D0V7_9PLEO|nr:uncharacterized protein CC84DRAFT_158125 [Paraphaeosphaeria sporulosa]OAG12750.1 hypothetical protein CC84DRAFT_158125 [Paraphaeosphaeria sporulosa]